MSQQVKKKQELGTNQHPSLSHIDSHDKLKNPSQSESLIPGSPFSDLKKQRILKSYIKKHDMFILFALYDIDSSFIINLLINKIITNCVVLMFFPSYFLKMLCIFGPEKEGLRVAYLYLSIISKTLSTKRQRYAEPPDGKSKHMVQWALIQREGTYSSVKSPRKSNLSILSLCVSIECVIIPSSKSLSFLLLGIKSQQ